MRKGYWIKQANIAHSDQFFEYLKTVVPWLVSIAGKIIAKSIEDYDVFQQKLIAEIQFTSMASSISLKEIKSSHAIPL